jgi:predicted RNase H-like HicB family nuclease
MKFKVILHPEAEGGFSVAVPVLPGCYSCGDTLEEALANIREALEGALLSYRDHGQEPPWRPEGPPEPGDLTHWVEVDLEALA